MRFLVANLKMKLVTREENAEYVSLLSREVRTWNRDLSDVEVIVCPSFPFLQLFDTALPKRVIRGAQDSGIEDRGARTGDVSPLSLLSFGVSCAIVGHSERREQCGETDDMIARKVSVCLRNGIRPILCIGETEEERTRGDTGRVLRRQVERAFAEISQEQFRRAIIAYEPRWAIGSDRFPSSDEVMEVAISVRKFLVDRFERESVDALPILYGGSVTARHIPDLCLRPGLSGVLVGRESLVPTEMTRMMRAIGAH